MVVDKREAPCSPRPVIGERGSPCGLANTLHVKYSRTTRVLKRLAARKRLLRYRTPNALTHDLIDHPRGIHAGETKV